MVFCVSQVPTFVLFPWIFTFVLSFCCATKISIFFFFLVFSFFLFLFFERNDAACSLRRIFAFYSFRLIFLGFYHLSIFKLPYFRSFIFLVFSFFLFLFFERNDAAWFAVFAFYFRLIFLGFSLIHF